MFKGFITGFLAAWGLFSGCPFNDKNCQPCNEFKYRIRKIGNLPEGIKESSGLALLNDLFISHGDSGNEPVLYGFNYPFSSDSIPVIMEIPDSENTDWEDLAYDGDSTIYIGDFGNNMNKRKDLNILKYDLKNERTEVLQFNYADQNYFPPPRAKNYTFDCEAMIWYKNQLYLFSKNRKSKFIKVFRLDDNTPFQEIAPYDTLVLKNTFVTSADINPDMNEAALLAYGKVLFFNLIENEEGYLIFQPGSCKKINRMGQAEAISYLDNDHLIITNEKGKVFYLFRDFKNSGEEMSIDSLLENRFENKNSIEQVYQKH